MVNNSEYLGMHEEFQSHGFKSHVQSNTASQGESSTKTCHYLFDEMVAPVLLYGSESEKWGNECLAVIDKFHRELFHYVFRPKKEALWRIYDENERNAFSVIGVSVQVRMARFLANL